MYEFFDGLFDAAGFPARWNCGRWTPFHGWLYVASDLGIWSAYLAIPCVLAYFAARRRDIPFRPVVLLFVAFIFACGTTHLLDAVLFWWPGYRLSAAVRFLTAVVSWATVAALVPTIPQVLSLRSPRELEVEIAERRRTEDALRASEERFRHLVEGSDEYAIFMLDAGGRVASWNIGAERIKGYKADEIVGRRFDVFYPPDDVRAGKPDRELAAATAAGKCEDEGWRVRKDGSRFWANVVVTALRDEAGVLRGFSKVTRDISARKEAEDQLRQSLAEQKVLLREVHHRVKNNLQVICSLLDMQMRGQRTPDAAEAFREAQDRVRSMALVHERLYQTETLSGIDLSGYIRDLVEVLAASYPVAGAEVRFDLELWPVILTVETAIPCGLIVNELVSNSLKHAFAGGRQGAITIRLGETDGIVTVEVADDGIGMPVTVDIGAPRTFGLRLVAALADQLHGSVSRDCGAGTTVRLTFPVASPPEPGP